ncbi:MAG: DUF4160 domain-containing protein [Chloroflexi bacterium]|nr:DUF4160 domain-containing protein [Chloroflexota bacterium]
MHKYYMSPTVRIIGHHRFFFFILENNQPLHIHVKSAENAAKFWLSLIELVWAVVRTAETTRSRPWSPARMP